MITMQRILWEMFETFHIIWCFLPELEIESAVRVRDRMVGIPPGEIRQ